MLVEAKAINKRQFAYLSDFSMKSQNVVGHLVLKYGLKTIHGLILQTYNDTRLWKFQG